MTTRVRGHHADAYALAGHLATRLEAQAIIDVGLGSAPCLETFAGARSILLDVERQRADGRPGGSGWPWIGWDATAGGDVALTDEVVSRSIVICAGVAERMADPTELMTLLGRLSRRALATIITTAERDRLHGSAPTGCPADRSRVSEWNTAEFLQLLGRHGMRPTFTGLMVGDEARLEKDTIVAICDQCPLAAGQSPPDDFRPLALVTTYNDGDIAVQMISKLLDDGIEVWVHDNWSTDDTFEQLTALAAARSDLSVERFPGAGPSQYFDLRTICRMKEEVAATQPGRWIIHHDSDEIRCSPWPGVSLRGGLYVAERMGYTAVDFTVCEFRPVADGSVPGLDLERHARHFEYSRELGHFEQIKVWRQPAGRVDLVSSGGHQARFPGRKTFPYKFLLKHYPLRTPQQARVKIFCERRPRYSPEERKMGWHTHYDHFSTEQPFLWDAVELIDFEAPATRGTYLLESIAGIGIVRHAPGSGEASAR